MITLYLVRHGQTVDNIENRIQGHNDSPLTQIGVQQAKAAAKRLSEEHFDAVYSSDLGRCVETAGLISNLPVYTTELLREAYFGEVQGMTASQFQDRYPDDYQLWRSDPVRHRPPGGETIQSLIERGEKFLEMVREKHKDGEQLLVVLHGGSLRGVICAALGQPETFYTKISVANASISIVDLKDRPSLRLLNDTCHLDSLVEPTPDADNPNG